MPRAQAGATARRGPCDFRAALRVLAGAALGAVAALSLVACGSPSPTLTRLRSDATRICTLADRQTDVIRAPSGPAGGVVFLRSGLAVLAPELSELRRLQAPSDTSTVYRAALDAFADEVSAIRQTVSALDEGQDPAVAMRRLRQRLAPLESAQDGAWQALNVPACVAS